MGMFKDIKKLSDQGKEVQKKQGKKPGMMGMIRDMPDTLNQATQAVDDAMALQDEMQQQQMLLQTGTPGQATITNFTDTGMLVNYNPQIILDLQVAIAGKDPYAAKLTTAVPQAFLGRLTPGGQIGVKVDPANPSSMAIDWTAV